MIIMIRMPNWLGDLVMSTAFVKAVQVVYPKADIHLIVKRGIDEVVDYLPGIKRKWIFDKKEYKGLKGAWNFGRLVGAEVRPDLFFCLPDSFSSAWMAKATGAIVSVGYQKELRSFLLTKSMVKDKTIHRVDQYLALLKFYNGKLPSDIRVGLENKSDLDRNRIVINVNSEASSRRLPVPKAVEMLDLLRESCAAELVLVGSPKEISQVDAVYDGLKDKTGVTNMAGKTNFKNLIALLGSAPVMLTTDSGPMHLANALGVFTVALEGASDERNTAPHNADKRTLIRYGKLPCEPCVKNKCKFGEPTCLLNMDSHMIVKAVLDAFSLFQPVKQG